MSDCHLCNVYDEMIKLGYKNLKFEVGYSVYIINGLILEGPDPDYSPPIEGDNKCYPCSWRCDLADPIIYKEDKYYTFGLSSYKQLVTRPCPFTNISELKTHGAYFKEIGGGVFTKDRKSILYLASGNNIDQDGHMGCYKTDDNKKIRFFNTSSGPIAINNKCEILQLEGFTKCDWNTYRNDRAIIEIFDYGYYRDYKYTSIAQPTKTKPAARENNI